MRALILCAALALAAAELPRKLADDAEGSGEDDSDEDLEEGSGGEFIEDLKEFGDHNKVLKVPDSDKFDFHFGKEDDYYEEDDIYNEILDDYVYGDKEEDSVLKVTKDEDSMVDIEIKPRPASGEDELLLDTAQILIMVGSAFISFGVVMLAFFICRQRMESSAKEKAMPYTIPASRVASSPIVKNYQRVPTTTQEFLAGPAHIEMYRDGEDKTGSPLLSK